MLSGGEQQMLAMGRAMMTKPRTAPPRRTFHGPCPLPGQEIMRIIVRLNKEGVTILLVEQNARMALRFAQRGYVLENGVISLKGASEELISNPLVEKAYLGG